MVDFEAFRPSPNLTIDVNDPAFDEPVDMVDRHLSRLGAVHFIDMALRAETLPIHGTQHLVVGGGKDLAKDRSSTTALVMPGTLANGIWPHIVARAESVFFMGIESGLRDESGNLVPIVIAAAPSMDSDFAGVDVNRIRDGCMHSLGAIHRNVVRTNGFKRVIGGVGMSQAAALLTDTLEPSVKYDTEDARAVIIEPPHGQKRVFLPRVRQAANFLVEGARFKKHRQAEGIDVIEELFATGNAAKDFEKGFIQKLGINLALIDGFAQGRLREDVEYLRRDRGIPTTVIRGTDSRVTSKKAVHDIGGLVEVVGANHSLGDRVGRFATLVAANLTS